MSATDKPLRVAIVGANAERGWARDAHLPALRALPETFSVAAVSARSQQAAEQAREVFGAEMAFGDSLAMVREPGIDLVAVTVKVPEHRAVVLAALAAGKHVHCEWPLGKDLAEAEEMAAAVPPGIHAMIGLQGLSAPAIRKAADLVATGAIGRPLSLRATSPTAGWGAQVPPFYAYLQDAANGATLETITGGHTLAAIEHIVGPYSEVAAQASILRPRVHIQGTGELVDRTCADHLIVTGRHGGCVSLLEVLGGAPDTPFVLEVRGETGWVRITGSNPGGYQTGFLKLETSVPDIVQPDPVVPGLAGPPLHLAESYVRLAADIRSGSCTVPDFALAVRISRLLETIARAATTGERQ